MTRTPLLISIPDFVAAEPFGRTKTYELIDAGDLETVCVGKRRFIVAESYRLYVERLKTDVAGQRRPSPNPKAASYAPGGHIAANPHIGSSFEDFLTEVKDDRGHH